MARMTLQQIVAADAKIDQATLDATTDDDIRRYMIEDGEDPDAPLGTFVKELSPASIRERVGLSQAQFASALMVPIGTLRNWEQGRVRPDPAARALLRIVANDPKAALAALGEERPVPTSSLSVIHAVEEATRTTVLTHIENDVGLRRRLALFEDALKLLHACCAETGPIVGDEATLKLLGARIYNSGASALKLGLSGYYQSALALLRDVLETANLLDYFRTAPDKVAAWRVATDQERQKSFRPSEIRKHLDGRDRSQPSARSLSYQRLCNFATHPSPSGFSLVCQDGAPAIGPFVDDRKMGVVLEEGRLRCGAAAILFSHLLSNIEADLVTFRDQFQADLTTQIPLPQINQTLREARLRAAS